MRSAPGTHLPPSFYQGGAGQAPTPKGEKTECSLTLLASIIE